MEYAQFYSTIMEGIENSLTEEDFSRLPLEPIEEIIIGAYNSLRRINTSRRDIESYARAYTPRLIEAAKGVLKVRDLKEKLEVA